MFEEVLASDENVQKAEVLKKQKKNKKQKIFKCQIGGLGFKVQTKAGWWRRAAVLTVRRGAFVAVHTSTKPSRLHTGPASASHTSPRMTSATQRQAKTRGRNTRCSRAGRTPPVDEAVIGQDENGMYRGSTQ